MSASLTPLKHKLLVLEGSSLSDDDVSSPKEDFNFVTNILIVSSMIIALGYFSTKFILKKINKSIENNQPV